MKTMAKPIINYIHHSGFALELADHFIIFDYYKGDIGEEDLLITSGDKILKKMMDYKNVFVMVSHGHRDHFNKRIFEWADTRPDINYIISHDIELDLGSTRYHQLKPYEELQIKGVKIKTFGSTDIGVSFLLEIQGIRVFHAGDLNWWHWAREASDEELLEAERLFKQEVSRIEKANIDIMFFPVDPRLGQNYYLGGDYMIDRLRPRLFVPMHFANDFYITSEFAKKMSQYQSKCVTIENNGQVIEY